MSFHLYIISLKHHKSDVDVYNVCITSIADVTDIKSITLTNYSLVCLQHTSRNVKLLAQRHNFTFHYILVSCMYWLGGPSDK